MAKVVRRKRSHDPVDEPPVRKTTGTDLQSVRNSQVEMLLQIRRLSDHVKLMEKRVHHLHRRNIIQNQMLRYSYETICHLSGKPTDFDALEREISNSVPMVPEPFCHSVAPPDIYITEPDGNNSINTIAGPSRDYSGFLQPQPTVAVPTATAATNAFFHGWDHMLTKDAQLPTSLAVPTISANLNHERSISSPELRPGQSMLF